MEFGNIGEHIRVRRKEVKLSQPNTKAKCPP